MAFCIIYKVYKNKCYPRSIPMYPLVGVHY